MRRAVAGHVPEPGERTRLDATASHHLLHVIRLVRGERVQVVDGRGNAGIAALDGVEDGCAMLVGIQRVHRAPAPARVVLLGMPRGPLLEEALTLGTEAGATSFVLARARRSPPGEARLERLERVVRAAVTQCGRADSPALVGPRPFPDALAEATALAPGAVRWLCEVGAQDAAPSSSACVLAIGPEGGFDDTEKRDLSAAGFEEVGLAPHVLRTPTAVLAGLTRAFTSRW